MNQERKYGEIRWEFGYAFQWIPAASEDVSLRDHWRSLDVPVIVMQTNTGYVILVNAAVEREFTTTPEMEKTVFCYAADLVAIELDKKQRVA